MLTEEIRPKCLSEIVGQDGVVQFARGWLAAYAAGCVGSGDAWFVTGVSGSGKTSLGHAMAGELGLSEWAVEFVPSRDCTVDAVRAIMESLNYSALTGERWKIVIVDDAQSMSAAAKDAWLSALERIPKNRLVIFTTTEPESFDLIWRSRCKLVELRTLPAEAIEHVLYRALRGAGGVSDAERHNLALNAKNNARAALQALEVRLLSGVTVTIPAVECKVVLAPNNSKLESLRWNLANKFRAGSPKYAECAAQIAQLS